LSERKDLKEEGYTVQPLAGGDYVLRVRHVKAETLSVAGK
jgi:hypothetical protein